MKKSNKFVYILIVVCVLLLILLSVLLKQPTTKEITVQDWLNDVSSGKEIVTVIGASYCSHCQEYKPVITKLSTSNNFNLYFFEIDTLDSDDAKILTKTFDLPGFDGSVPYTFIIKENNVVDSTTGFSTRSKIVNFLESNGIMKELEN